MASSTIDRLRCLAQELAEGIEELAREQEGGPSTAHEDPLVGWTLKTTLDIQSDDVLLRRISGLAEKCRSDMAAKYGPLHVAQAEARGWLTYRHDVSKTDGGTVLRVYPHIDVDGLVDG